VRWYYAAGLGFFVLLRLFVWFLIPAAILLIVTWAIHFAQSKRGALGKKTLLTSFSASVVIGEIFLVVLGILLFAIAKNMPNGLWMLVQLLPLCLVPIAALILAYRQPKIALCIGLGAVALAVLTTDPRDAWSRFSEEQGPLPELDNVIGNAKNIYWESSVDFVWFHLQRPSYYSCVQGTGVMFYEKTAMEYARRGNVLSKLNTSVDFDMDDNFLCIEKANPRAIAPRNLSDIRGVCAKLPDLDLIVLMSKVGGLDVPTWRSPAPRYRRLPGGISEKVDTYYFYDCRKLRAS
jgi:hypothetical protein